MSSFTLATLRSSQGAQAAIGVKDYYYLIHEFQPDLPSTVRMLLDQWETSLPMLEALANHIALGKVGVGSRLDLNMADFETPVMFPDKLMAVGANYSGHLKEMGLDPKKWASMPFFLRPPKTTLVGPGETVQIPKSTKQFDWELELVVIVGKHLRHASKEEAAAAVAGYSIGLDLSCRDLIQVDNDLKVDLVRGKAQDTMAPCGPYMVPAKFVPNPYNLHLQLWVNGEKMMDASSAEMLYHIDEQLSIISEYLTIEPGDILFTGSPSGSAGVHGNRWLKPGDRIHAEIEAIGSLDVIMKQA
ncbi:MAG: fumarylacetoacetate hydrolase family protein [Rhizonema sp. PD37]|nr:fumarylacetoacetate hydrolase family protein [Rhizonema sp. PD37]